MISNYGWGQGWGWAWNCGWALGWAWGKGINTIMKSHGRRVSLSYRLT